jgi:hypothetical protein
MLNNYLNESDSRLPPGVATQSVDECVGHVLARIDEATRERNVFIQWDGQAIPW